MKKLFFLTLAVISLASCASTEKLTNTSSYARGKSQFIVAPVCADLKVSNEKINFFMQVSNTVRAAGEKNVIETAVREALTKCGNADVLIGLQTQIKYNSEGQIESIVVTGYPAVYVNFRNAPESLILTSSNVEEESSSKSVLPFVKKK